MRLAIALGGLLLSGTAHAEKATICTDRPTKANSVCTVPAGNFQMETSTIGWSRLDQDGSSTNTFSAGSSVVKFGLSAQSDLQLAFTPFVRVGANGDHLSGSGDMLVRYKHRLMADDAKVQVAVIPFVKLPTAKRGIGNREWEGGVALPIVIPVSKVTVTLGPELNLLADADGHGRHVALVNLVNLSGTIAPRLTLAGELWSNFNFDPDGTLEQASADAALSYAVTGNLQIDAGINVGLTNDTADVETYTGLSLRF